MTHSASSEFVRKVRTLAGLVQICHRVDGCLNPARNPVWSRFVLHKLSRLACPYALLLASWPALAWKRCSRAPATGWRSWRWSASSGLFGAPAVPAAVVSLVMSFLALNLAALWAMPSYYLGRSSVTWRRVEVDRT